MANYTIFKTLDKFSYCWHFSAKKKGARLGGNERPFFSGLGGTRCPEKKSVASKINFGEDSSSVSQADNKEEVIIESGCGRNHLGGL